MSLEINEGNYKVYKQVYEILCRHLYKDLIAKLPSESHPISVLNNFEAKSTVQSTRALKIGLVDALTSLQYYPNVSALEINAELLEYRLPSIYKLQNEISNSVTSILKAKTISNAIQYYIAKEIIDDTTSNLSSQERQILSEAIDVYEKKATNH